MARAADWRHSRWRDSSRASRARGSGTATLPRSSGPRSAISPAMNGPSTSAAGPPGAARSVRDPGRPGPANRLAPGATSPRRRAGTPAARRPGRHRRGPCRRRRTRRSPERYDGSPRQPGSIRHDEPAPTRPEKRSAGAASRGDGLGRDCDRWMPSSSRQRCSAATAIAAQEAVDGVRDVGVDEHLLAVLDLDDDVEGRRRLPLQDALLGPAAAGLLVAEGHALDAADEVGQRRVEHQVVEVVAVRRADELDAALGDRPGRLRLELRPDLVDDDDLGHVVLDRLDHHLVLERGRAHLHPAGLADRGVRDVAVAGDLVRGVDDDDALAEVVGQDAGRLAEHRRLADARAGP